MTNAAGATISGTHAGVFASGAAATINNSGAIGATGAGGTGADIESGGSLVNNSGGSISGTTYGVFLSGGGTITNAGTISGGSYAINFATSPTNRLIVDPGAAFPGGVNGGGGALELATGTGTISGIDTGTLNHFQELDVDAGASWTLNGQNAISTLVNNGALAVAGSLTVSGAVDASSAGSFQLSAGTFIDVAADTGAQNTFNFLSGGQLAIDNASQFGTNVGTTSYAGPQLQNFAAGDTVDLKSFGFTGASFNFDATSGLLQLTNGANQAATLSFQTASLGTGSFQIATDGANGIFVTHS
jgi:hypothetical protein